MNNPSPPNRPHSQAAQQAQNATTSHSGNAHSRLSSSNHVFSNASGLLPSSNAFSSATPGAVGLLTQQQQQQLQQHHHQHQSQQQQPQQQLWNAPVSSSQIAAVMAQQQQHQQQQQQQLQQQRAQQQQQQLLAQHSNLRSVALHHQSIGSHAHHGAPTAHINFAGVSKEQQQQQQQHHGLPSSSYGAGQGISTASNSNGSLPASWGVPNPLLSNNHGGSRSSSLSLPAAPAPAAIQAQNFGTGQAISQHPRQNPGPSSSQMMAMMKNASAAPPLSSSHPSQQLPGVRPPHAASTSLHPLVSGQQPGRPIVAATTSNTTTISKQPTIVRTTGVQGGGKAKVTLTPEAKRALAKAIWSAIRHPQGEVSPSLMAEALSTGLPRHAILNAARVAREREAMKRNGSNPIIPPVVNGSTVSSTTNGAGASTTAQLHVASSCLLPQGNGNTIHSHQRAAPQDLAAATSYPQQKLKPQQPVPSASPVGESVTPGQQAQQIKMDNAPSSSKTATAGASTGAHSQHNNLLPSNENKSKTEELMRWKRVQNGIFMVQKDRFVSLPCSVGAVTRSTNCDPSFEVGRKRIRDPYREARDIQNAMLLAQKNEQSIGQQPRSTAQLLDPERFKRAKVEPKKYSRALDRHARKARQNVAEGLSKQLKDLHKQLGNHQADFNKFHRSRKAEFARVCKSIRDYFDKESKKKERDVSQAEKARLAALRANDMTAYSKLLEETRNDRLKFLLEKTEKHFTQISSVLQQRSEEPVSSQGGASYYATAHMKTEEVRQPSILVGGDLKEYQLTGLQWLISLYNNDLNGILADEMGLGKTIQAISLVAYHMEFKQNLGPFLVIVPLSTLSNWQNEFAKWCPAARVVCYKGLPVQRREIYKELVRPGQFNVLLTTYEYIIRDKNYLRRTEWQYAIVDEGHRMKNAESKFAVTLGSQYTTKHRILLTGTPLMNDLSELWSLLNFLLPTIFNSVETFDQWFSRPFAQFGESKAEESREDLLSNEERILIIHRLHELLRPFMLRRVKSEVLDQLPEKVEKVLRCDLSSWQKELYKQISRKAATDTSIISDQAPTRGLNNVVMQLRKVCNFAQLFSPEGYHINDTLIRSSGKMVLLDQMLPKFKLAGHRVLLFTQMTAVMTILEDYFALRGFLSLRLDGSTPAEEREKRMFKFNSPDSPYFIFLLSTRAGGLGLNLTSADTVIIFDSDWNPMMDLQAQDRAHRIGQRSTNVSVFRLITNSPVEEKILSRATEKLNVSELVVESGKFNKESVDSDNSLERKRLMEVLLTDFDTAQPKVLSEKSESDEGDDEDGELSEGGGGQEDLNELLSNNEMDYQLYTAYDEEMERNGTPRCTLFEDNKTIPDWILHPAPTGASTGNYVVQDMGNASRKRKAVSYDDGLSEKQFVRIMEQKADEAEGKKPKKKPRTTKNASAVGKPSRDTTVDGDDDDSKPASSATTGLSDWTFRKLISCAKSVVDLKDPISKRKLSDIFLEKPDPATFPDYYELIEKPIAINDILRKCRAKLYPSLKEFKADWKLMFANALEFNGEGSWVVEDAQGLEKELERVLKKNGFSDEEVPISTTNGSSSSNKKKILRIKLSLRDTKNSSS